MGKQAIPLSVELATGWKALGLIRHEIGIGMTATILSFIMGAMHRGEPFGHLPKPADRREILSRRQVAPAILLYKALCERMDTADALVLTRKVAIEGARAFLRRMVGILQRDNFEQLTTERREAFVLEISEKFFNSELEWDEISSARLCFRAVSCCFPGLCEAAQVPELASFFCEGDELFFREDLEGVEFDRPHTIATGAKDCPFSLRWIQDEEELP
jgi:hypothetical protein